jgi:hypothetical protein
MRMCQINSQREDLVVLTGISAGTYDVSVSGMLDNGSDGVGRLEKSIEFDGTHDVDVDLDTRDPK